MMNRSKLMPAAFACFAVPLLFAFSPFADSSDDSTWLGSPAGAGAFLNVTAADVAEVEGTANCGCPGSWLPTESSPDARAAVHPNSSQGTRGKNCSTKTGRLVCCSAMGVVTNCTSQGRTVNCSAYNLNPESSEFCSVGFPNAFATCTSMGIGNCSAFDVGGAGGKVHCSVSQGSNSDCTTFGGGTCTTNNPTGNRCSVFGQPSSAGPCQG